VVERKNRSFEKLARTMLSESSLPNYFWADAVSISCYVMNRVLIRPILKKTRYELFNGRKSNINHLRVFCCSYFVLNKGKENLGKFDEKADHGIFIGYSLTSHAYKIYNKRLMTVEESVHVVFDEVDRKSIQILKSSREEDEHNISLEKLDIYAEKQPVDSSKQLIEIMQQSELPKEWRIPRDLPVENIIGQIKEGVSTRSSISNLCRHTAFVSQIEPKSIDEALKDEKWVQAMHEELNQFARNDVWFLVPKTVEMNIIGSKWVFRNKLDEDGVITRNKARLVPKGYNQEVGIDYGETFAPVARLEAVRLLLAFACMSGFKLFQMDVKSAFLNGYINEEVYVHWLLLMIILDIHGLSFLLTRMMLIRLLGNWQKFCKMKMAVV